LDAERCWLRIDDRVVLQQLVRELETGYADFEIVLAYLVWDSVRTPIAAPFANTAAAAGIQMLQLLQHSAGGGL
jgi:hypothetical protein